MDKMTSTPVGSRRNSAVTRKDTIDEAEADVERESNLNAEMKKLPHITLSPEGHNCKQYVQTIDEDSVESPTQGCSPCIECTM
jgi:hypothetical protein